VSLIRANALSLPLADESVDLIVTSPPYYDQRDYGYEGQIGTETTPADFVAALLEVTRECVRVLKPSGSLWVNLGDKYASKSLLGIPWRYAIGCTDDLGLILRATVLWSKPNGLPESVKDRVGRGHEDWFHFTKGGSYFAAIERIRGDDRKLPNSVWSIPTEPLYVPDHLPQHFAAFPLEWPRRVVLGWSPDGVCSTCGEGRAPVIEKGPPRPVRGRLLGEINDLHNPKLNGRAGDTHKAGKTMVRTTEGWSFLTRDSFVVGESCSCGESRGTSARGEERRPSTARPAESPLPPTRSAVVLDPFCGTGTTVAVANALGRHGLGIDLSSDFLRLARWRCQDRGLRAKVLGLEKPKPEVAGQLDLLGGAA